MLHTGRNPMIYEVKITEHRERIVKVKAADEDEAIAITSVILPFF